MGQSSPDTSLLAEAFYKTDIMIGKFTEFLYYIFLFIRIFIGTDMDPFTSKHRISSFQIFTEQAIDKLVGFRFEQIQVIHTIFFATDLRTILRQCQ